MTDIHSTHPDADHPAMRVLLKRRPGRQVVAWLTAICCAWIVLRSAERLVCPVVADASVATELTPPR